LLVFLSEHFNSQFILDLTFYFNLLFSSQGFNHFILFKSDPIQSLRLGRSFILAMFLFLVLIEQPISLLFHLRDKLIAP